MSDIEEAQQAAVNESYERLQQVAQEIAQLPEPARSAAAAWAEALLPDSHVPHDDIAVYEKVRAIADRWVTFTMAFLASFPEAGPAIAEVAQEYRPIARG